MHLSSLGGADPRSYTSDLVYVAPRLINVYVESDNLPDTPGLGAEWTNRHPGDLFVASAATNGGTQPALSIGQKIGGGSINQVVSLATYAFTSEDVENDGAPEWSGAAMQRCLWHLRFVGRVFAAPILVKTDVNTAMTWPSLAIGAPAIVGGHLVTETAQTDVDGSVGLGAPFTPSRFESQLTRARFGFDSGGAVPSTEGAPAETLLAAFAPAPDSFDTATRYAVLCWAAEGYYA